MSRTRFFTLTQIRTYAQVYMGDGGLLKSACKGSVFIDCSTIDPGTAKRVASESLVRTHSRTTRTRAHTKSSSLSPLLPPAPPPMIALWEIDVRQMLDSNPKNQDTFRSGEIISWEEQSF